MSKRVLIVCAIIAVLAIAGYWFILHGGGGVVATVNGQGILRSDLNSQLATALAQYEAYGIEITDDLRTELTDGVLDELIAEALIAQSAEASGIVIEETDVDDFYQEMVAEYESEEAFLTMLEENDYTVARLRDDIARHLLISQYEEQYIAENVDPASLLITEAEKRELYDSYAVQYEDIPPYDEIAEHLELELRDQKIYELGVIEALIEQLRESAEIEITI